MWAQPVSNIGKVELLLETDKYSWIWIWHGKFETLWSFEAPQTDTLHCIENSALCWRNIRSFVSYPQEFLSNHCFVLVLHKNNQPVSYNVNIQQCQISEIIKCTADMHHLNAGWLDGAKTMRLSLCETTAGSGERLGSWAGAASIQLWKGHLLSSIWPSHVLMFDRVFNIFIQCCVRLEQYCGSRWA